MNNESISIELKKIKDLVHLFIIKRIKKDIDSKAIYDIVRQVYHLFPFHEIEFSLFEKDFQQDCIFNPSVLLSGGDLYNYIKPKYNSFAKELYLIRSIGLGTPNAACGEGELMALLLSPRVSISSLKNSDLIIDNQNIEIKGLAPRFFGNKTGKEVNKIGLSLIKKYNLNPNICSNNRLAVEPWENKKKEIHWENEFNKIGIINAIEFLYEYMNNIELNISKEAINSCFILNKLNINLFQQEILKSLFLNTEKNWDKFTNIVNGKVYVISNSYEEFIILIDKGIIKPSGNFFRMFQDCKIGWYCEFN